MNIAEISSEIHENAKAKGFFQEGKNKNIGEMLMLMVTEVSEAMEADRIGNYCAKQDNGRIIGSFEKTSENYLKEADWWFEQNVKHTFEDEMADIVIRVMDMCAFKGIDLEWHILRKIAYNKTRPFKHGNKKC